MPLIKGLDGNYVTMEAIVRPWVDVVSFSSPREIPLPPPVEPEAFFRHGQASQFTFDDSFRNRASGVGFRTEDPPPGDEVLQFVETGRDVTEVRVENPEDADQYVIVEVIDKIDFDGPNNTKYRFIFTND